MPGRDLTPSEKIDQEYEQMIQLGAVMILIALLLAAAYKGLTYEDPRHAEIILYFDQKTLNDPNQSSEGFVRDSKDPQLIDPKMIEERQKGLRMVADDPDSNKEN